MAAAEEFDFTPVQDDQLFSNGQRVQGKVVLITGAAAGIGKETAAKFAEHGAIVVIGDKNIEAAQQTVNDIVTAGGKAICKACDVTVWDDLSDLFEHTIKQYGSIDVVVSNAGVGEIGSFSPPSVDEDGRLRKPNLTTIDVNLVGTIYTAHLAQHYLAIGGPGYVIKGDTPKVLKSLVLLGSIASWKGIPRAPLYTATKHAVLGLMRSLHPTLESQGIRISVVHPFFVNTGILSAGVKLFLAGLPLPTTTRVAGAIFYSATDPDPATNGSAWLLLDDGPVVHVPKEDFKFGVYGALDKRINSIQGGVDGVVYYSRILKDVAGVLNLKVYFPIAILFGITGYFWRAYTA